MQEEIEKALPFGASRCEKLTTAEDRGDIFSPPGGNSWKSWPRVGKSEKNLGIYFSIAPQIEDGLTHPFVCIRCCLRDLSLCSIGDGDVEDLSACLDDVGRDIITGL